MRGKEKGSLQVCIHALALNNDDPVAALGWIYDNESEVDRIRSEFTTQTE